MRRLLFAGALTALALPALAGDIGLAVTIAQPGIYGQINIGNVPRPPVIYAQPVVVRQAPEFVSAPPIYLHVPPGHERHWREHCAEYHACGRPVYFVQHDWYQNEYVPHYRHDDRVHGGEAHREHEHDHDHEHDREHGHDHEHHEHEDRND